MPADYPPFMNAYGSISKILNKIIEAKPPERFSQDFLSTSLGFNGGSYRPIIGILKRIGFLSSDGVPTHLYHRFRNSAERGGAMAEAIRHGYQTVFARNEYAHQLDKAKLGGLLVELTRLEAGAPTIRSIEGTFNALKQFADFEATITAGKPSDVTPPPPPSIDPLPGHTIKSEQLRFSYTIYLNLPNTDDIAVFNAIFKSLRENLPLS